MLRHRPTDKTKWQRCWPATFDVVVGVTMAGCTSDARRCISAARRWWRNVIQQERVVWSTERRLIAGSACKTVCPSWEWLRKRQKKRIWCLTVTLPRDLDLWPLLPPKWCFQRAIRLIFWIYLFTSYGHARDVAKKNMCFIITITNLSNCLYSKYLYIDKWRRHECVHPIKSMIKCSYKYEKRSRKEG